MCFTEGSFAHRYDSISVKNNSASNIIYQSVDREIDRQIDR